MADASRWSCIVDFKIVERFSSLGVSSERSIQLYLTPISTKCAAISGGATDAVCGRIGGVEGLL
jgi:hypothetical protein